MSHLIDESHGNYRSYYERRRRVRAVVGVATSGGSGGKGSSKGIKSRIDLPHDEDERLRIRPLDQASMWVGKRVLDIGCNVGEVSVEIARRFRPSLVVGVDIDISLIKRCKDTVQRSYSLQNPRLDSSSSSLGHSGAESASAIEDSRRSSKKRKRSRLEQENRGGGVNLDVNVDDGAAYDDQHYFPSFFPDLFGPIYLPSPTVLAKSLSGSQTPTSLQLHSPTFPDNVTFVAADWVTTEIETDKIGYDVILAFSLTKWIHLHHLDSGLLLFFQKIYAHLSPGGFFILEKQDWAGYKDAKRGNAVLTKNYWELKLRPERDFGELLLSEKVGFRRREEVKGGGEGGFQRSIEVYIK